MEWPRSFNSTPLNSGNTSGKIDAGAFQVSHCWWNFYDPFSLSMVSVCAGGTTSTPVLYMSHFPCIQKVICHFWENAIVAITTGTCSYSPPTPLQLIMWSQKIHLPSPQLGTVRDEEGACPFKTLAPSQSLGVPAPLWSFSTKLKQQLPSISSSSSNRPTKYLKRDCDQIIGTDYNYI